VEQKEQYMEGDEMVYVLLNEHNYQLMKKKITLNYMVSPLYLKKKNEVGK
jgi:hypothetical protein